MCRLTSFHICADVLLLLLLPARQSFLSDLPPGQYKTQGSQPIASFAQENRKDFYTFTYPFCGRHFACWALFVYLAVSSVFLDTLPTSCDTQGIWLTLAASPHLAAPASIAKHT